MTSPNTRGPSVRALAASLTAIAILAAAPFALATVIGGRRLAQAQAETAALAREMHSQQIGGRTAVLVGPGNLPHLPQEWAAHDKAALSSGSTVMSPDPWRNAYLVNAGAPGVIWVVSAGPNGILETPFEGATGAHGDDITARIH